MILSNTSIHQRVTYHERLDQSAGWDQILNENNRVVPKAHYTLGILPYNATQKQTMGMSYGLGPAGYDIRAGALDPNNKLEGVTLRPGAFRLLASLERIKVPHDILVIVHDKSSLARKGLALQNTVLEPGWEGYITLELSNHGFKNIHIMRGQPIAQLVFHLLDQPTTTPYKGKYQDQPPVPVEYLPRDEV